MYYQIKDQLQYIIYILLASKSNKALSNELAMQFQLNIMLNYTSKEQR